MRPDRSRARRSLRTPNGPRAFVRGMARAALPILALVPLQDAAAQRGGLVRVPLTVLAPRIGNVPFHPGEELKFEVSASVFGGGEATMRVGQIDTVHGFATFPVEWHIKGSLGGGLYKLNDQFYSWMDTESLISRRFVKNQQAGTRNRAYDFFPEEQRVHRTDHDTTWALPSPLPLDDLSFLYFARTQPLEVGDSYTFNRYFKDSGNPVTIHVLRKDTVETAAGVFSTVVVQPILPESALFARSAKAEIHFSDDDRRLMVYMRVTRWLVPLTMELTEFTLGVPAERGAAEGDEGPVPKQRPAGDVRPPVEARLSENEPPGAERPLRENRPVAIGAFHRRR